MPDRVAQVAADAPRLAQDALAVLQQAFVATHWLLSFALLSLDRR